MKRFLSFVSLVFLCVATLSAQEFLDHLTSKEAGQGAVTIHQDPRLDDIVNGKKQFVQEKKEDKTDLTIAHTGRKVKARGYRIQVYWGGSARADQANAQRAGTRVTALFPELRSYTTFESPNWRCRVGDFATHQEATEYLNKLKEARVSRDAIVVKSEIYIYQ